VYTGRFPIGHDRRCPRHHDCDEVYTPQWNKAHQNDLFIVNKWGEREREGKREMIGWGRDDAYEL